MQPARERTCSPLASSDALGGVLAPCLRAEAGRLCSAGAGSAQRCASHAGTSAPACPPPSARAPPLNRTRTPTHCCTLLPSLLCESPCSHCVRVSLTRLYACGAGRRRGSSNRRRCALAPAPAPLLPTPPPPPLLHAPPSPPPFPSTHQHHLFISLQSMEIKGEGYRGRAGGGGAFGTTAPRRWENEWRHAPAPLPHPHLHTRFWCSAHAQRGASSASARRHAASHGVQHQQLARGQQ